MHNSLRLHNKTKRNIFIHSVRLIRIALKNGYIVKTNNGYALIFQYALKSQVRLKTRVYGIAVVCLLFRELGTALPKADSQQEAVILMLQKRVEILKERLGKMESDATQKLVLGTCNHFYSYLYNNVHEIYVTLVIVYFSS